MRVGIAADHGGFALKQELATRLKAAGYEVVDFGAACFKPDDDYPDFVAPLACAVAAAQVERGVAIRGSGVGACVCANKIAGVRAALIADHFSAGQGVEDDHLNVLCLGGRTEGVAAAWDLVETFLSAQYSRAERHLRRLTKVAALEAVHQQKGSADISARPPRALSPARD
jgi:ribose 5-phosphate isomerase B